MSNRHRNMKFILDEAMDDLQDEDYSDEEVDEEMVAYKKALVLEVFEVIGKDHSYKEIEVALEKNQYNVEKAVLHFTDPPNQLVFESKKKHKNNRKKRGKKKRNQPREETKPVLKIDENLFFEELKKQEAKKNSVKKEGKKSPGKSINTKKKVSIRKSRKSASLISNDSFMSDGSESVGGKKRRRSSGRFEKVITKMVDCDKKPNRKDSKHFKELFNDKNYGNHEYPSIKYKFDKKVLAEKKHRVTIVISGHVDSGKSTLLGQIMVQTKQIDKNVLRKLEKMERDNRHQGNHLQWISDEREDEREKGITVDVNEKYVTIGNTHITFLDTPGHCDLVPKMISGASQCQFAILIVDAERNQFESGFDSKGQTKEHSFLLNSIEPKKLLVLVNKMDQVKWNYEDFEFVHKKLIKFFENENMFTKTEKEFMPISALKGQNIDKPIEDNVACWWSGGCLFDYLKKLESNVEELLNKPFRMNIQAHFVSKEFKRKGSLISGRVEGGVVKKGDKLIIKPIDIPLTVKDIYIGDNKEMTALPGDIVDMVVTLKDTNQWENIRSGLTLSSIKYHIPVSNKFLALVGVYNIETPILKGSRCNFHFGPLIQEGKIISLKVLINPKTEEHIRKHPRFLRSKDSAIVEILLEKTMCFEIESNFPSLGRFQFRDKGKTLGVGKILTIL